MENWVTDGRKTTIEDQYQCHPHPGLQGQRGEQHAAVVNASQCYPYNSQLLSLIEKHAETSAL